MSAIMEHLEQRELLAPLAVGMVPSDPATSVIIPDTFKVNFIDVLGIRDNQTSFLDLADVTNIYDVDRDQKVNATDMLLARDNQTHFLNALRQITVPLEVVQDVLGQWIWQTDSEADSKRIRHNLLLTL